MWSFIRSFFSTSTTQVKRASAAPLLTPDHYAKLLAHLAAAVVIRDRQGTVLFLSPFTQVLSGVAIEEMLKREVDFIYDITHPDDKESVKRALKVADSGEPFQYRSRLVHGTGIEVWIDTRTVPLTDQQGEILGSLSVSFDITSTVRYERLVEEQNRELQDLSYMISHDLKGPLATVRGMTHLLKEEHASSFKAEAVELLDHLDQAGQRLELLVGSILDFAKLSSLAINHEEINLEELISDVKRDLAQIIERENATIRIINDKLPTLGSDRLRLYQIFYNLISNSIKYRSSHHAPQITISVAQKGNSNKWQITISDNSRGIPQDKLPHVFRPFHRFHREVKDGVGLGLASVKKMVTLLGGEISLKSEVEVGTTFVVEL
jgi:PAS domain S-box-containing protein